MSGKFQGPVRSNESGEVFRRTGETSVILLISKQIMFVIKLPIFNLKKATKFIMQ